MSAQIEPAEAAPNEVRESYDVADVARWLVDGARSASQSQDVLTEMCRRLAECGLPLWRVAVYVNTLHPQTVARRFLWRPGGAAEIAEASFAMAAGEGFRFSPITRIRATGETIRRRLADPGCPMDYKIPRGNARGRRDRLSRRCRSVSPMAKSTRSRSRRCRPGGFTPTQVGRARGDRSAAFARRRSPRFAADRRHRCSTPMSAMTRASGFLAAASSAATPRRSARSSGSPTCAASRRSPIAWRRRR